MNFKLPKMEKSFDIQINGVESKLLYNGKFVFLRPSLGAQSNIDVMHKRLNGDLITLKDNTFKFNEAVSYLRFALIEYPEWWKDSKFGHDLYDANVVIELYNKCMGFEEEFMSKLHSKDGEEIREGENKESKAEA